MKRSGFKWKPTWKRLKPVSDKKRLADKEYSKVRAEYLREHPVCEVAGCSRLATVIHHKKGRGIYYTDKRYFMATCWHHNELFEKEKKWAIEMGYRLDRHT